MIKEQQLVAGVSFAMHDFGTLGARRALDEDAMLLLDMHHKH